MDTRPSLGTAVLTPVLLALRAHWAAVLLLSLLGALCLALLIPGQSFWVGSADGEPSLLPPYISPSADASIGSADALDPMDTQGKAIRSLLDIVGAMTCATFAAGALTILLAGAARARQRASEIGIHRSVGASRRRIMASLFLESAASGSLATILGVIGGSVCVALLLAQWPGSLSEPSAKGVLPALAVCVAICVALLSPLWIVHDRDMIAPLDWEVGLRTPALQLGTTIALLLTAASLFLHEAHGPASVSRGTDREGTVMNVDSGVADAETRSRRYVQLFTAFSESATEDSLRPQAIITSGGEMLGLGAVGMVTADCGRCYIAGIITRWSLFRSVVHALPPGSPVSPRRRLVAGRGFTSADTLGAKRVVVINRNVRVHFDSQKLLGRILYIADGWPSVPYEVVGVVEDLPSPVLGGAYQPHEQIYVSILQHPPRHLEARLGSVDTAAIAGVRSLITTTLGPNATVGSVRRATDVLTAQTMAQRWFGTTLGTLAFGVLVIGLVGVFYSVRRWVESMKWELGLRRTVGASRRSTLGFISIRLFRIVGGGIAWGLIIYLMLLAPPLSWAIKGIALDPAVGMALTAIPVLLGLITGLVPAHTIARTPPAEIIQHG